MSSIRAVLANSVSKFHLEVLYKVFSYSGLGGVWYRIMYRSQMKQDIEYYRRPEVQTRIKRIIPQFADDESRVTYKKAIKFRQRRYGKDRPRVTYPQYFLSSLIGDGDDEEVFIDGGGFIGDTYSDFINWSHNRFKSYVFFEPSTVNLEKFKERINDKRVRCRNEGLWNKKATLYFSGGTSEAERIIEGNPEENNRAVSINVTAIDLEPECEHATFIKMDIEGSELNALKGAINTIRKNRPKLVICIYHDNEDMLRIPEWCFKNLNNYRFYVRHHHYLPCDTVLYAIPVPEK